MRRALVNLNPEQVRINEKYVMKITGDDDIGRRNSIISSTRKALPSDCNHLRTDEYGCGCADLQTGRARSKHSIHDQI